MSEQFRLGLFENPYVDASEAPSVIGSQSNRAKGLEVQKQSIVLLQNQNQPDAVKLLPLRTGATVYTIGMAKANVERYGFRVIDGNAAFGQPRPVQPPATSPSSGYKCGTRTPKAIGRRISQRAPIPRGSTR